MIELANWFEKNARSLPWRCERSPYRVWVSEIMLQQTRASVVVPYFERWMAHLPTVESLAAASVDEVVSLWEGLGYYSRARNLRIGASQVAEQFGGQLPSSEGELLQIRGIGPYTAGAIRSFAFQQRAAAVDGNVMRVLARYWLIEEVPVAAKFKARLESALPLERPWVAMEALIELGALICTPKAPRCELCPLAGECKAKRSARQLELPLKKKRPKTTHLVRHVAVIECAGSLLVRRAPKGEVMADLHHFPYAEEPETLEALFARLGINPTRISSLSPVKHGFTRYSAHLIPSLFRLDAQEEVEGFFWSSEPLSFCSGHREIRQEWQCAS